MLLLTEKFKFLFPFITSFIFDCSLARSFHPEAYGSENEYHLDPQGPIYLDAYNINFKTEGQDENMYYDLNDEGSTIDLRGWVTPIAGNVNEGESSKWSGNYYSYGESYVHDSQIYSRPMETLRGWSGDVPSYYSVQGQSLDWSREAEDELDLTYA